MCLGFWVERKTTEELGLGFSNETPRPKSRRGPPPEFVFDVVEIPTATDSSTIHFPATAPIFVVDVDGRINEIDVKIIFQFGICDRIPSTIPRNPLQHCRFNEEQAICEYRISSTLSIARVLSMESGKKASKSPEITRDPLILCTTTKILYSTEKSERIMEKTAFSKFTNNPSDPVLLDEDDSDFVRTIPKKISARERKKMADAEFKIVDRLKLFS
ncbi:hypothetical protein L1887_06807 [Cichorium endivia]|nr:hypothetical protein L1887_06807 [Cichorium endivia]